MFTSKKILTAALVALTVATASLASTGSAMAGPHHHRHGHGWGWGAGGLAAGLVLGSAIASRPAYGEPVYVERQRRCFRVERTNRWGEVIGTRRVCRTYE
jgi:hypothetical protein